MATKSKKIELETSFSEPELGQVGSVDVWLVDDREETYLGAWYGDADVLARRLGEDDYLGLSRYVLKFDGYGIGYIAGMEVRHGFTGRGIGTAMLEACLDILRQQHVDIVFIHRSAGTRSSDAQLKKLYERIGFRDVRCCARDFWPVMKMEI